METQHSCEGMWLALSSSSNASWIPFICVDLFITPLFNIPTTQEQLLLCM